MELTRMSKEYIIPIFLPHGGCKKRCVFCNEYSATGFGNFPKNEDLDEIFNRYLGYFSEKSNVYIAYYGSSFTGMEKEKLKYYLDYSQNKIEKGYAKGIRFSTSPEEINEEVISILKDYDINLIELGIQSFNDEVLKQSNRPHDLDDVYNSVDLLEKNSLSFGIHLMTGLPGSNYEIESYSVKETIKTKAKTVRIHPTVILKGTVLETQYKNNKYIPETLEEAVEKVSEFTIMIEKSGKNVIRYGLCLYDDQINNVVAGPYHQSFGDLVKTQIIYKLMKNLDEELTVPMKLKPQFLGYKKKNKKILEEKPISFKDINHIKLRNKNITFKELKQIYL
jgi:histone acetyltransferase (RNA polymerase elongator complex component)